MSRFALFIVMLLVLGLYGCQNQPAAPTATQTTSPVAPTIQIVPTETSALTQPENTATPTPFSPASQYFNAEYGFSFELPADWEVIEYPDYVQFTRPGAVLFVGFQRADEPPKPFRTGMPGGEMVAGGTVTLLDQPIPKSILVAQGKNKVVAYGGRMTIGNLVIVIYLDAVGTPDRPAYEDFQLTPELMAEADSIVSSFKFASGEKPTVETIP